MNYYEHHLGDYAQATAHLTFVEDAAYSRLLRRYYATEAPLPADVKALQRLVAARTKEEREAVEVVLAEFFTLKEDGWHNARCDEEIARFRETQPEREAKRANAKERKERFRQRRAEIFEQLRQHGIVPPFETSMPELNRMLERVLGNGEERDGTQTGTRSGTTTQTPDTRHQTPEKEKQEKRRGASPPRSLSAWANGLPAGEKPIPPGDPVFAYAEKVGLPEEFLRLAWRWMLRQYAKGGPREGKRYADWRKVFRNAVEGNWGKLWYVDGDGRYALTTVGLQLQRALGEAA